ncbi:MAG: hypothetical protein AAB475_01190, partial [Patescibacteria group bacterium]
SELKEFAAKEKLEIVASLSEAQTAKEPIKNVGSNFMKARSGLFEFLLIKFILFGKVIVVKLISLSILV